MNLTTDPVGYNLFLSDTEHCHCWWCGLEGEESFPFGIQRCHITNTPRLKDRRCVVLMCSRCHQIQHGAFFDDDQLPAPTTANLLWLKMVFDPNYYSRAMVERCSITSLPRALAPPGDVVKHYLMRRRAYPGKTGFGS